MDQTPFQPYQNTAYQQPTPWANANTYAPWDPDGAGAQAGQFDGSQFGGTHSIGFDNSGMGSWAHALDPMTGSWFGLGKKRSSPNFYAPSYQGNLFTPAEGLPQYFGTSMQGQASDATLQSMMGNNANASQITPNANQSQTQSQGASGLQSYGSDTMPSYIGQSPWLGNTVNNYAPQSGGSYGGYDSYGGYGSSQNTQTSQYQPFVPTGGQY